MEQQSPELRIPPTLKIFTIKGIINEATASDFTKFYSEIDPAMDPFALIDINSTGGEIYSMNSIISIMENDRTVKWITYTGSVAMSAGLLILAAGDLRFATDRALLMFHDSFKCYGGTDKEVMEDLDLSKKYGDKVFAMFYKRTKKPASFWKSRIKNENKEFYFYAEEAKKLGVIDRIGIPSVQRQVGLF